MLCHRGILGQGVAQEFGSPWSLNCQESLPKGPKVVPFGVHILELYKVSPKRNYFGALGYLLQSRNPV